MHVISASAGQASAGTTEESETGDSRTSSFARPRMQRVGRTIIEYYLKPRPCEACKMVKFQVRLVPRRERAPPRTQFVHEQYLAHPEPLEPEDDEEDDVVINMENESMFDASKAVLKARRETCSDDVLIEFKERGKPDVCASLSHLPPVFLVMWARSVLVTDPETGRVRQIREVPIVTALSHKNIMLDGGPVPLANVYVLTRSVLQVEHQYIDLKMALLLDTGEKSFTMADGSGPSSLRLSMRATNALESESVWSERSAFNSRNDSFITQRTDDDDQSEEPDMEHLERFIHTQRQRNADSMARRARAPDVMRAPAPPSRPQSSFVGRILSSVMPGSSAGKPAPLKKEEMVLEFFGEDEEGDAPPPAVDTTPLHATSVVSTYGGAESMHCSGNGYVPSNESSSESERRRLPQRDRFSPRTHDEAQEEEEHGQLPGDKEEDMPVERVLVQEESLASASSSSSEEEQDSDDDDDDDDDDDF